MIDSEHFIKILSIIVLFLSAVIAASNFITIPQKYLTIISGAIVVIIGFLIWLLFNLLKEKRENPNNATKTSSDSKTHREELSGKKTSQDILTNRTVPKEVLTDILATFQDSLINIITDKFSITSETGNIEPAELISIYQFGSTAPSREEFSIYTSNINILCIVKNDAIQNELITNLSTIEEAVKDRIKNYTLRIFTSYHEDKHSPSSPNQIKMYLLIRGATYLADKTLNQPLFVYNISKDYKLLFGKDYYESINIKHVESLIKYDSLVFGMGGLHEMIVFLADSGLLINKDPIAYLRSLKYAFVRCCQLAIFFELGSHITKTSDVLTGFQEHLVNNYKLEFEEENRLHDLIKTITNATYFEFIKIHPKTMVTYHKTILRLLVATKNRMAQLEEERKRDYASFRSIIEMKVAAQNAYNHFRSLNSCSRLIFTTHSLDDIALCLAFYDLATQDQQVESAKITIHESPSLMKEFGLKDSSNLFNFQDKIFSEPSEIKNSLIIYIGSRTIYGNYLYTTINTFANRSTLSINQLRWGYILLNANPNDDKTDKWTKRFNTTYSHIKPTSPPEFAIIVDKNNKELLSSKTIEVVNEDISA